MRIVQSYIRLIDALNERIGILVSWLTTFLVITVCYDVFTRYLMNKSSAAVQELEWHFFAVLFLFGSSYTLKHDKHVRVDIFYGRLSDRKKALINLAGSVLFLIPFASLVIWSSLDFVRDSYLIHESSPDPGGLSARYILKACIPLSFFLLILQAFSLAGRSFLTVFWGTEKKGVDSNG